MAHVLNPTPHQLAILEEKMKEVIADPGRDEADREAMRDFYRTLMGGL